MNFTIAYIYSKLNYSNILFDHVWSRYVGNINILYKFFLKMKIRVWFIWKIT